jgi:hypothetical protein
LIGLRNFLLAIELFAFQLGIHHLLLCLVGLVGQKDKFLLPFDHLCLRIIDTVDEQAKALVEKTEAKMIEWEKKLVLLADQADKAKEKMMNAKLEREKLNGQKKIAHANYNDESAAYKAIIPPFEREIYVITMIKIKINQHCEAVEAKADAESS